MQIDKYSVTLTGNQPLLLHHDSIKGSDHVDKWVKDPQNKNLSKAGDDRFPGWRWINYLYYDDSITDEKQTVVALPSENIMRCIMEAGRTMPLKGNKTLKSNVMSGMATPPEQSHIPVLANGKPIPMADLLKMRRDNVLDFDKHIEAANKAGMFLFVKRAGVNGKKHVRVRPRISRWSMQMTLHVWDPALVGNEATIAEMLTIAGRDKGLGDWRPSSPKSPGPYGTFEASIKRIN